MKAQFRKRRLPHWDVPGAMYFVTTCLAGSIPAEGLLDIRELKANLEAQPRPENMSEDDWRIAKWKKTFARTDEWLDDRPAVRHLEDERLAVEVVKSMLHFADQRYELWAYVVMPSHLHWVFRPLPEWEASLPDDKRSPREIIMHSLKRFTASQCNVLLHETGTFWQDESYDHCVRDEAELERIIDYVEINPVKPGLAASPSEWRFSSAWLLEQPEVEKKRPIPVGQVSNLPGLFERMLAKPGV